MAPHICQIESGDLPFAASKPRHGVDRGTQYGGTGPPRVHAMTRFIGERERRLFAATEAKAAGFGGIAAVSQITGMAVSTIGRDLKEPRH
jgi:hypothetical protein